MTVIIPEMLDEGMSALVECRKNNKTDMDTVVAVFLAMRAIEEIVLLRADGTLH